MKLTGGDRNQFQMVCPEAQVAPDSYARVVDASVDFPDLKKPGFETKGGIKNGRPAFMAEDLLKLYCYGYLNRVRPSRRPEREARANMECTWPLRGPAPRYRVTADSRGDTSKRRSGRPVPF